MMITLSTDPAVVRLLLDQPADTRAPTCATGREGIELVCRVLQF